LININSKNLKIIYLKHKSNKNNNH